ncbi:hypothetical protein [Bradyrhizobium sp.]|uniref:hypothetical protein n=1 Tax=Bradyrhizobium sp. TaxID=376 RepID=UPI003C667BA3
MTERTSAIRPTSDCSPDTSGGQLSVGSATASPGDDSPLLVLEKQFNTISAELFAIERLRRDQKRNHGPAGQSPERSTIESCVEEQTHDAVMTEQIESVLARLHPIERAIMQTPAHTMAGLSVKARHAAYVTSQYWEAPIDKLDWDARVVRLLIEAVCDFARTPLPFWNVRGHE